MPIDPVCGMEVEEISKVKSRFNGQDFYFCCPHCKSKFESDPAQFTT
ncbi:YHS domain-containing protein [Candidatus Nitrosotenuis chungbukensis]|nr:MULTISPECIES: YHS domain-containing protein [Nitrosotenuis]QLH09176.1 YHS domain-containing protein [Candidatus Nitrosotenuis sp. DW1]WKT57787.1 YHS domain-containing protein [Candidatus Nitrosotenuis chungbukensis]